MAYQGLSLGDIYAQATAIKGAQQRQALGDIALQQGQNQLANEQGIQQTLANNPNATSADFAKYGRQGLEAYGQLSESKLADLTNHLKEQYTRSGIVAASDNPIAAAQQYAPEFIAHYDQVHGQGSFAKLTPEQVKQGAQQLNQESLAALQDPQKAAQNMFEMAKTHFEQSQQNARTGAEISSRKDINVSTQAAEDRRAAASRAVTMRGQDLEAGRANKPQLVTVKNPDGTETQKWVMPGQTEGPALGPPSQKPLGEADKKNAVLFDSMLNAEKQIQSLTNKPGGATDTSSKWNAFLGGLPVVGGVTKVAQTDEFKKYEAAGLRWAANLLYLKSGATANPDEIRSTWKQFFPQPGDGPDVKAQKEQARAQEIESTRKYMVPQSPGLSAAVPTATGPNGQKLYLRNGQWSPN